MAVKRRSPKRRVSKRKKLVKSCPKARKFFSRGKGQPRYPVHRNSKTGRYYYVLKNGKKKPLSKQRACL